jgi:hypothetical protein
MYSLFLVIGWLKKPEATPIDPLRRSISLAYLPAISRREGGEIASQIARAFTNGHILTHQAEAPECPNETVTKPNF